MSSIMGQIETELPELFALEFEKLLNMTFVYILIIYKNEQICTKLGQMYVIIRSRMSSIMDLIGPKLSELSALELESLPYLTLFSL